MPTARTPAGPPRPGTVPPPGAGPSPGAGPPRPDPVLPLRPLTVGEQLDSAVLLFREHARPLVAVAAGLAVGEQALLHPLRVVAEVEPPAFLPLLDELPAYWLLLAVGAATEVVIIALLGNLTGRAATAELLGAPVSGAGLLRPRGARYPATLLVAAIGGAVMFVAALVGPTWLIAFALLGSLAPAVVVDRLGPVRALGRAVALATRSAAHAGLVRLLGYLVWWILRLGITLGVVAGLGRLDLLDPDWAMPLAAAVWAAVNSVAYPLLASLDAVLHVQTRVCTEGLDILVARARRTGRPLTDLAVPRR